jgi:hypothetical protein
MNAQDSHRFQIMINLEHIAPGRSRGGALHRLGDIQRVFHRGYARERRRPDFGAAAVGASAAVWPAMNGLMAA